MTLASRPLREEIHFREPRIRPRIAPAGVRRNGRNAIKGKSPPTIHTSTGLPFGSSPVVQAERNIG